MSPRKLATIAALGISGISAAAAGTLLLGAPAAYADTTTAAMPTQIASAAAADGLTVEQSNGWEAITGAAASINTIQELATTYGVGTIADYTGNDETGTAILVFTGNHDTTTAFHITGATVTSADNDTDQPWYVYTDDGAPDATVPAGTAEDIPPADLFNFSGAFSAFNEVATFDLNP
jgi:hypothetical protein